MLVLKIAFLKARERSSRARGFVAQCWLERLLDTQEVTDSSSVKPTTSSTCCRNDV